MANPTWIVKRAGAGGGPGIGHRTLLVKDTTPGDDIADHVTAYRSGTAQRLVAVLRKTITAALVVRVNKNGAELITMTIPPAQAVDEAVEISTFVAGTTSIADGDVFSWDITASDNQKDKAGVAAFTLEWS
jgi:hypothetical protein